MKVVSTVMSWRKTGFYNYQGITVTEKEWLICDRLLSCCIQHNLQMNYVDSTQGFRHVYRRTNEI